MKTFHQFITESTSLKPGMVFRTTDTRGDLVDTLIYVKNVDQNDVVLLLPKSKKELYTTITSLNVDKNSIRKVSKKDGFMI